MGYFVQTIGFEPGMSSKTTEQFLPKRRGVVAMVSELKYGHYLPGFRRPLRSPRQQQQSSRSRCWTATASRVSPQQSTLLSDQPTSWTVTAFEVTTANLCHLGPVHPGSGRPRSHRGNYFCDFLVAVIRVEQSLQDMRNVSGSSRWRNSKLGALSLRRMRDRNFYEEALENIAGRRIRGDRV